MNLIVKYLKNYKLLFFFNVISVFGFILVELGIPTIVATMIDVGVTNKDISFIYMINLFKPIYINDKGYRFYSYRQYDTFKVILALKKLGMSLKYDGWLYSFSFTNRCGWNNCSRILLF